jgi:hypothetical protein
MKNLLLDSRTARDIDSRVARLHRDLGHRGGKVELAEVRALLKLDIGYYSARDPGLIREVVHKLKVGAKQVIQRPGLLLDAVRKFDLKALFIPDRKQILLDADLPDLKKRWSEGHEVLHSVLPWHGDYMLGDNAMTLTPSCHDQIEAEANYGTGRLLFPGDEFIGLVRTGTLDLARIRSIAGHFGNTITSTLWRSVEQADFPCFGLIGEHPHFPRDGKPLIEHLIQSPTFAQKFSNFGDADAVALLRTYCGRRRAGPIGVSDVVVTDDNGDGHVFSAESFGNSYHTLTLVQYVRPHAKRVVVA